MNKRLLLTGALLAALTGCGVTEPPQGENALQLPPCTGKDTVFAALQVDAFPPLYHTTVARVIDAHLETLDGLSTAPLRCVAEDFRGLTPPSQELLSLAEQLPEWGPSRSETLSEADLAPVLLEFLRTYECALVERGQFLYLFVLDEHAVQDPAAAGMQRGNLTRERARQGEIIRRELAMSRPALERTLAFIGGLDRFRPLSAELECLKRASLDLKNGLGLLAEAASCMPKIWDARGSLRDLTTLP